MLCWLFLSPRQVSSTLYHGVRPLHQVVRFNGMYIPFMIDIQSSLDYSVPLMVSQITCMCTLHRFKQITHVCYCSLMKAICSDHSSSIHRLLQISQLLRNLAVASLQSLSSLLFGLPPPGDLRVHISRVQILDLLEQHAVGGSPATQLLLYTAR